MAASIEAKAPPIKAAISNQRQLLIIAHLLLSFVLVSSSGCISFMANMVRVIKGTDLPAEYDEFQNKKVAVVASTPAGINSDATGIIMSSQVHALLATNVKKIQMINQEEVARIINDLPADKRDMTLLGKRMGADYIVVVDVQDLKLRDGQTLFKGTSNTTVSVYKIGEGTGADFRKSLNDFVFPSTGVPVTDLDEATFHRFYLSEVAQRVARSFYPYDPSVDVAKDASVASIQSFR
jgi:hypothetical protein